MKHRSLSSRRFYKQPVIFPPLPMEEKASLAAEGQTGERGNITKENARSK
jgi:hypothetical protein